MSRIVQRAQKLTSVPRAELQRNARLAISVTQKQTHLRPHPFCLRVQVKPSHVRLALGVRMGLRTLNYAQSGPSQGKPVAGKKLIVAFVKSATTAKRI
jgi:hypothetical protein